MTTWWASLSLVMKILWGVTLAASLIFIIQSILTFIGADAGDGGIDTDFDTGFDTEAADAAVEGGTNLYTFRNFVNFILGFGWSAILLQEKIHSVPLLLIVSAVIGVALVAVVMYLFKWLSGMQQSGNINVYKSAVGCNGTVYLTIPGERGGEGKVQISINNAVREYDAVTDGDALKTGTPIRVTEVINANTVLVEPLEPQII
ncbi:MAG: NfeD family protein [Bacteroidales bacterium]|nr:NfeD family protein [Bacteroidales bacterium]MBQ2598478.1 NfeD family protein [Bacteroidales bacterium]MBQ4012708.1 NfeD family protein [Bacteroidales bacterium]